MTKQFRLNRRFDVVKDMFGGSQMWFKSPYNVQTGCGPVALTNAFAWFMGLSLSQTDMLALQEKVQYYLKGPVLIPQKFIKGARKLFKSEGFDLTTRQLTLYRSGSVQRKELILFIAHSLEENRPLALLLGPNQPSLDRSAEVYRKDFSTHWVLITGMDVENDDAVIYVSSWATEFQLELWLLLQSKVFVSCVSMKLS